MTKVNTKRRKEYMPRLVREEITMIQANINEIEAKKHNRKILIKLKASF